MYIYITFSLSIHLLIDIWFASTPWLLKNNRAVNKWIWMCIYLFSILLWSIYLNFTVKKSLEDSILTKLLKLPSPVINGTSWYHMLPERRQQKTTISVIFLPKIPILNLDKKKHLITPNWETFYEITGLIVQKLSSSFIYIYTYLWGTQD